MEELISLPHKLTLQQREELTMTGVTEVVCFDEGAIILRTRLGMLTVLGRELSLKTLSLEGGQVAVKGHICSLTYEEPRSPGLLKRLLG